MFLRQEYGKFDYRDYQKLELILMHVYIIFFFLDIGKDEGENE